MTPASRLAPPKHLPERARQIFVDLVLACKPDWFTPSDLPLLARYCEASALAEQAAAAMAGEPVTANGKPSAWVSVHAQMTKALCGLSMRLRLSPQARQPNRPTRPVQTSYYDRLKLEGRYDQDRRASTAASDPDGAGGELGKRWTD
jgi:phage terminase small subunit